jgi:uncharacterized protein
MWIFSSLVGVAATVAGMVASVTGFGIGSLLTPLFSLQMDTKLAVAAVSIPHVLATAIRFWMLRANLDRRLLLSFGIMSAVGGLTGALVHSLADSIILSGVFGILLVFAGVTGLTGFTEKMRFRGWLAWVTGALSGLLGGLVGNQGGIRSAAMLGFEVRREAFVATATAIGLVVDGARMPVYLASEGSQLLSVWTLIAVASLGTIAGTFIGRRVLTLIPEKLFRRIVSAIILALGLVFISTVINHLLQAA